MGAEDLSSPEVDVYDNPIYSAVEREHFFKNHTNDLRQGGGRYIPIYEMAPTVADHLNNNRIEVVEGMASHRGMSLEQFTSLAAATSKEVYGDGDKELAPQLSPKERQELSRAVKAYEMDPEKLSQFAQTHNRDVGELLRRYGRLQANTAAAEYEGDVEALRRQILEDLEAKESPGLRRMRRQHEKETGQIETEYQEKRDQIEAEHQRKVAEIPEIPSREDRIRELAGTLGINWEEMEDAKRREILDMETKDAFVALHRHAAEHKVISAEGLTEEDLEMLEKLQTMESEHDERIAELKKELGRQEAGDEQEAQDQYSQRIVELRKEEEELEKELQQLEEQRQKERARAQAKIAKLRKQLKELS